MKAEELMLGDWVQCERGIGKVIHFGILYIVILVDGKEVLKKADEVQPIELTPEILEKNGFVLKEEEAGMFGVKIAPHYIRDDVPFEVFCDGEPFAIWFKDPVNIEYVHQLQQALRLSGIDKEIVVC